MISRIFEVLSRRIDGPLMAALALTLALGLTVVYSASGGSTFDRAMGQGRNLALGIFALWLFAQIPPQMLMRMALPVYVAGLALLIGVALFGDVRNGARRWLNLGVTVVQPSEIMKIGVPLVLAWYFHRREEGLRMRDFAIAAIVLALPVGLIVRQPDLGTALLIFASGFFVIFLAGLSWKVIVSMGVTGAVSLPFLWSVMHDYQRKRILTLLDPMEDPLGAGYHIIQSTIAIGS
ncbi:MAG TPA: FtsW/RodA/SpoVE family cell cycle protein, partial [Usitatibacter sp.]